MAASYPYQAGVCNIGPAEVRKRARAAWLGLAGAVGLGVLLVGVGAAPVWRVVLFAPLVFAAVGFVQARGKT